LAENDFNNNKIGNKVDNPYFMRFLLYLSLTVIIMGVIVGLIFVYQQKVNLSHNQFIIGKINQTLAQINLTKAEIHEDQARQIQTAKQNKFEMLGRANQTKLIMNQTQDLILKHDKKLRQYIDQSSNNTQTLFNRSMERIWP